MGNGRESRKKRLELLTHCAELIINAAGSGALTGQPVPILRAELVAGPRAGAVELHAGMNSGRLLRALSADDCALARQFIPWHFTGEPAVYMAGRFVRIEAGWPDSLAEREVRLDDLGAFPKGGGRWVAGKNELGQTVILGLNDRTPHWLIGGTTGSGKTVGLRSAVLQLSRDANNRLVLLDGKWGSGLGEVAHVPGLVGPLATDVPTACEALAWVIGEMKRRYRIGTPADLPRVIVVVDEFQDLVTEPVIREMLRRILAQGRAAGIHALMATQHPTNDAFGDNSMKRNIPGRVALMVTDAKASEVVIGGPQPRADHLLGQGDAYCITPRAIHRTQLALVDRRDLQRVEPQPPLLDSWPEFRAEDLSGGPTVKWAYSGEELAEAEIAARLGHGRNRLVQALEAAGLGRPGAERAIRLLNLGRETVAALRRRGWELVSLEGEGTCLSVWQGDTHPREGKGVICL